MLDITKDIPFQKLLKQLKLLALTVNADSCTETKELRIIDIKVDQNDLTEQQIQEVIKKSSYFDSEKSVVHYNSDLNVWRIVPIFKQVNLMENCAAMNNAALTAWENFNNYFKKNDSEYELSQFNLVYCDDHYLFIDVHRNHIFNGHFYATDQPQDQQFINCIRMYASSILNKLGRYVVIYN